MTTPGITYVIQLLSIADDWLEVMDDLDPYEDQVVGNVRTQICDTIANLEGLL